jgi:hypothetical protein
MFLRMKKVLALLKRMPSNVLRNPLHEESLLHLHGRGLQIKESSHPGVHLTLHLGASLILHLFVAEQILLLSGMVTHLLAGGRHLQLEGTLLLHHLESTGHLCVRHLGEVVAVHYHADAPLDLLDGAHHLQGG